MRFKSIWMACVLFLLTCAIAAQPDENTAIQTNPARTGSPALHSAVVNHSNPTHETGPTPKIVVSQPRFNFGSVVEDETVVHEFTIANKGDGPMNIKKVKTG